MLLKIKTSKGIKLSIEERKITDFEFVRALADVESKDEGKIISGWVSLSNILFGDQYDEIMESLKDEDGYTSTDKVIDEIHFIMNLIKESREAKK